MWTVWPLCTAILAACRLSLRVLSAPLGRRAPKALCCPAYGAPSRHRGPRRGTGCRGPGAAQATAPCRPPRRRPAPSPTKKRPEEKEFFRPGRPPRQPRTACPPVRRAQVVGCGERGRLPLSGPIRKGLPGRAHRLKFEAFQFRHGKIGMEQGRIPGIGPQQQAQAQGDHQAGHPGRGRGDDAFVAGAARRRRVPAGAGARNGPRVRNPRPAARSRARTAPPPRRNVLPVTFSAQGRPDSPGPHPYLAACPANFFHRLPHAARPGPDGPPCRAGRAP